jgi:agmatine deiminase
MIITFLSDKLLDRHPGLANAIFTICRRENAFVRILEGTNDIWIRDYMPIVLPSGKMVQFTYSPSYLKNGFEHLITESGLLYEQFGFPIKRTQLIMDGGNYVRAGNKILICDRVLKENPTILPEEIKSRLKFMLDAEEVILLPTHPNDPIGHADGIVAAINSKHILVNELEEGATKNENEFHEVLCTALKHNGFRITKCFVDIPENGYIDNWDARGSYLNFTCIGNTLVLPVYQNTNTTRLLNFFIPLFPKKKFWLVNCEQIAKEGGALHCATWTA